MLIGNSSTERCGEVRRIDSETDKSIIVRDYAAGTAGNLAKAGPETARRVCPAIRSAIIVHGRRHAHHALQGLECVISFMPEIHDEVRELTRTLTEHPKKVIRKSAKSFLSALDEE